VGFAASSHAKKNRIDAGFGGGGGRSDGGGLAADAVVTEAAATEKAKLDAEKDAAFAKAALDADMRQGEGCGVQGGAGHGEGGRTGRGHEGRAGRVPGGVRPEVEPDGDGAECGGTGGTARAGNIGHWDLATPVDCRTHSPRSTSARS
jgi:hypothetical protein